jgi:hypothetical protein
MRLVWAIPDVKGFAKLAMAKHWWSGWFQGFENESKNRALRFQTGVNPLEIICA